MVAQQIEKMPLKRCQCPAAGLRQLAPLPSHCAFKFNVLSLHNVLVAVHETRGPNETMYNGAVHTVIGCSCATHLPTKSLILTAINGIPRGHHGVEGC